MDTAEKLRGRKKRSRLVSSDGTSKRSKRTPASLLSEDSSVSNDGSVENVVACPDSTQPDLSNGSIRETDLSANYRRFSARERKKTQFFNPYHTPRQFLRFEEEDRKSAVSGVRRALQFDRLQLAGVQRVEPEVCVEDDYSLPISSYENVSIGIGIQEDAGEPSKGRVLHREPKPQVVFLSFFFRITLLTHH